MNDSERQLIDLLLDGQLPVSEQSHLLTQLEGRPDAVAYLAERMLLHGDLRHSLQRRRLGQSALAVVVKDDREAGPGERRRISRFAAAAVAVAATLLLTAFVWRSSLFDDETRLFVASADEALPVERGGATVMLRIGDSLRPGDVVAARHSIIVSYLDEETRLELSPATRLEVLPHRAGKQLRLLAGSLSADVAPQPESAPMRLFLPGAEAVVLGTHFTLNTDAPGGELAVQKGAVRLNRTTPTDSIVVSAQERVKLGATALEVEPLPPTLPVRWRDEHTLAFDFESEVNWPVLRFGRVADDPSDAGRCLAGELVELPRHGGSDLVLGVSLRPQCLTTATSRVRLRYWAASGVESIRMFLYVFGVERAFIADVTPEAHDRWVEWSLAFDQTRLNSGVPETRRPPSSGATLRSISIHTSPVNGPLPFFVDDVVLEDVSTPPSVLR